MNIEVRSIVGRYLEHSRVYHFANGDGHGRSATYFGSADLMPRNLDRRVEAVTPVLDEDLSARIADILAIQLADDTLVVLTGDHGECFGSPHASWGHGARLYQEGIQVPFVVWNPRLIRKGRHLPTIGSHVDVSPTITDIVGLPADDRRQRHDDHDHQDDLD